MESAHGCWEINLRYLLYFIHSFRFVVILFATSFVFRFSFFYRPRHVFIVAFFPAFLLLLLFSFLINISRYYLCFRILFPFRCFTRPSAVALFRRRRRSCRWAIPRNCAKDKSQRPCSYRNAILFCYSERYAQNFIGYSEITAVGNCNRGTTKKKKTAHDKSVDVSRCSEFRLLCATFIGNGDTWDLSQEYRSPYYFNSSCSSKTYTSNRILFAYDIAGENTFFIFQHTVARQY